MYRFTSLTCATSRSVINDIRKTKMLSWQRPLSLTAFVLVSTELAAHYLRLWLDCQKNFARTAGHDMCIAPLYYTLALGSKCSRVVRLNAGHRLPPTPRGHLFVFHQEPTVKRLKEHSGRFCFRPLPPSPAGWLHRKQVSVNLEDTSPPRDQRKSEGGRGGWREFFYAPPVKTNGSCWHQFTSSCNFQNCRSEYWLCLNLPSTLP